MALECYSERKSVSTAQDFRSAGGLKEGMIWIIGLMFETTRAPELRVARVVR
jgi:hypothetical protein